MKKILIKKIYGFLVLGLLSIPHIGLMAASTPALTPNQTTAVMGIVTNFILDDDGLSTIEELAIEKIKAYATSNGVSASPTIQDYIDAGVTGINNSNLADINEVVGNLTASEVDTASELQALANALGITTIMHNGTTYGFVTSPYTGKVWLDRNLGADRVCTSFNDTACYGDYYQWGRNADGHEDSQSGATATQAADVGNVGHGNFIIAYSANDYDWAKTVDPTGSLRQANWSKTDGSSVCPIGFRVPNIIELRVETLDNGVTNKDTAFSSFLALPSAGIRSFFNTPIGNAGSYGSIWASSGSGSRSDTIAFNNAASLAVSGRAGAFSVRCIKN